MLRASSFISSILHQGYDSPMGAEVSTGQKARGEQENPLLASRQRKITKETCDALQQRTTKQCAPRAAQREDCTTRTTYTTSYSNVLRVCATNPHLHIRITTMHYRNALRSCATELHYIIFSHC